MSMLLVFHASSLNVPPAPSSIWLRTITEVLPGTHEGITSSSYLLRCVYP